MPLYEYVCQDCHNACELLVRGSERPLCPNCQSQRLEKLLSVTAAPVTGSASLPVCGTSGAPRPAGGCGAPWCGTGGCGGM
ncbi:MAG: zinc ribbon domain-containing protein [Pirellulales bacterium]|nr:zinc ribbon domain-containing protein [Pirellulales bacterium]